MLAKPAPPLCAEEQDCKKVPKHFWFFISENIAFMWHVDQTNKRKEWQTEAFTKKLFLKQPNFINVQREQLASWEVSYWNSCPGCLAFNQLVFVLYSGQTISKSLLCCYIENAIYNYNSIEIGRYTELIYQIITHDSRGLSFLMCLNLVFIWLCFLLDVVKSSK